MVEMDGFESVTCLDFSANVIRYMQARYAAKPQLNYLLGDATDMRALFSGLTHDPTHHDTTHHDTTRHTRHTPRHDTSLHEPGQMGRSMW
jgi:hypothetical protein